MLDMTCPTVRIKSEASAQNPAGFIVINETDFNDTMTVFTEQDSPIVPPTPPVFVTPTFVPQSAVPTEEIKIEDNAPDLNAPTGEAAPVATPKPWETPAQ